MVTKKEITEEFIEKSLCNLEDAIAKNDVACFCFMYYDIFSKKAIREYFISQLSVYGLERLQEIEIYKAKTLFGIDMPRIHKLTFEEGLQLWKHCADGAETFKKEYEKLLYEKD